MKNNRLLIYILINVVVSAITTLTVLVLWDFAHQTLPNFSPAARPASASAATELPANPVTAEKQGKIQIDNVFGAGHLDDEMVVVKHTGEGETSLAGWKLVDEQNHQYTFPQISLSSGTINIHTRSGSDSAKDLYWNQPKSIWQTGKKVRIYDPSGYLQAEYSIP